MLVQASKQPKTNTNLYNHTNRDILFPFHLLRKIILHRIKDDNPELLSTSDVLCSIYMVQVIDISLHKKKKKKINLLVSCIMGP